MSHAADYSAQLVDEVTAGTPTHDGYKLEAARIYAELAKAFALNRIADAINRVGRA